MSPLSVSSLRPLLVIGGIAGQARNDGGGKASVACHCVRRLLRPSSPLRPSLVIAGLTRNLLFTASAPFFLRSSFVIAFAARLFTASPACYRGIAGQARNDGGGQARNDGGGKASVVRHCARRFSLRPSGSLLSMTLLLNYYALY